MVVCTSLFYVLWSWRFYSRLMRQLIRQTDPAKVLRPSLKRARAWGQPEEQSACATSGWGIRPTPGAYEGQEGSKILGSSWSPNRSRAMRNPPYIEGMKPTPLQPRLYINTGLRGSKPMSRTRDSL